MAIRDHINRVPKLRAQITEVDPKQRIIEGATSDGSRRRLFVADIDPGSFIWPKVGEEWSIYDENGYWILGKKFLNPDESNAFESLSPGDAYNAGGSFPVLISGAHYVNVTEFGANPGGLVDSAAAFNAALAASSAFIQPGIYYINDKVDIPLSRDLIGAGAGDVILKLGPLGQISHGARDADTPLIGGRTSGFTVDGQHLANVDGGIFYVGFCLKRKFENLVIKDSAGDNIVIETAQNCTWDTINNTGATRSCLVFDYGAGGHVFYNMEAASPGRHSIEFRQTGNSFGGYPTFLGPSNNLFYGGIAEYGTPTSTYPLIYHGAGTNNQFYGFSSCPTGRTVTGSAAILMEAAANAITTTCTVTSGSSDVVVANPSGITPLMAARIPGFPAGSVVANVVGSVVTMFGSATSSHSAGTSCSFGAESSQLEFDGLVTPGSSGLTYGIEMKGNCSISLSGRSTFTNHIAAFKTYSSDRVSVNGPVSYFGTPTVWVAHPDDDSGVTGSEDICIRSLIGAGLEIRTAADNAARGLVISRPDQAHPHTIAYPSSLLFSDGSFSPVTTGVGFSLDSADGLHYLQAYTQMKSAMLKITGAAGATVENRFFGRRTTAGPPPSGTWMLGDWIIDSGGSVWACTVAGTPGTWQSGSRPTYVAPTFSTNVSNYSLGDPCGSSVGGDHRVLLRGALITSAAFASGSVVANITSDHRPSSPIVVANGVRYDSGGVMTPAPVAITSNGNVTTFIALGSGDALFLDGISYHAA